MSFVDFAALKESIKIEDAIHLLGLQMKQHGNQWRGACPACKSNNDRALVVTPGKGFYCWNVRAGGDVIQFAAHVLKKPVKDAAAYLAGKVQVPKARKSTNTPGPPPVNVTETKGLQPLTYLEHDHAAVEAVGFDPVDAERLGIGYASKGTMNGYVLVPIRLSTGQLVGYIGITDAKLPKSWRFEDEPQNVVKFQPKTA